MFLPFVVSVIATIVVLFLVLKNDIPKTVDIDLLKPAQSVLKHKALFYFSWIFLAMLLIGYFIGDIYDIPISVFALGGGLLFLLISTLLKTVEPTKIIKNAPWQVVWFSLGLYVVVYGLKNAGLTEYLTIILQDLNTMGNLIAVVSTGFISAFLSAFMNNMPTIMIMDIALKDIGNDAMIYANIVGCNLGPKMTPFGSLATLLWLHTLNQQGIKIGFWQYSKFGLIVTPPILLVVLLTLV